MLVLSRAVARPTPLRAPRSAAASRWSSTAAGAEPNAKPPPTVRQPIDYVNTTSGGSGSPGYALLGALAAGLGSAALFVWCLNDEDFEALDRKMVAVAPPVSSGLRVLRSWTASPKPNKLGYTARALQQEAGDSWTPPLSRNSAGAPVAASAALASPAAAAAAAAPAPEQRAANEVVLPSMFVDAIATLAVDEAKTELIASTLLQNVFDELRKQEKTNNELRVEIEKLTSSHSAAVGALSTADQAHQRDRSEAAALAAKMAEDLSQALKEKLAAIDAGHARAAELTNTAQALAAELDTHKVIVEGLKDLLASTTAKLDQTTADYNAKLDAVQATYKQQVDDLNSRLSAMVAKHGTILEQLHAAKAQLANKMTTVQAASSTGVALGQQAVILLRLQESLLNGAPIEDDIAFLLDHPELGPALSTTLQSAKEVERPPTLFNLLAQYRALQPVARRLGFVPPEGGLWWHAWSQLMAIVVIPPTGVAEGDSVDAVLARVLHALENGNTYAALQENSALPEHVRVVTRDWEIAATKRAQVELAVQLLRAQTLARLQAMRI